MASSTGLTLYLLLLLVHLFFLSSSLTSAASRCTLDLGVVAQSESMPECTFQEVYNEDLESSFVLEGYDGTCNVSCVTHANDVITFTTLNKMAETYHKRGFTLSLTYECNGHGVLAHYSPVRKPRLNVVEIVLLRCIIRELDADTFTNTYTSSVRNHREACVSEYSPETYLDSIDAIINSGACPYGVNAKYYESSHHTVLIDGVAASPDNILGLFNLSKHDFTMYMQNNSGASLERIEPRKELLDKLEVMLNEPRNFICSKLERLELSNSIKGAKIFFNFRHITARKLRYVDLSSTSMNEFTFALLDARSKFRHLEKVDLSSNNISYITFNASGYSHDPNRFKYMPHTPLTFDFRNCKIKTILKEYLETVKGFPFIRVDIRNNPIKCDCDMDDVLDYMRKNRHFFSNSYYAYLWDLECQEPAELKGRKLRELHHHQLCSRSFVTGLAMVVTVFVVIIACTTLGILLYRFRLAVKVLVNKYVLLTFCPNRYRHFTSGFHVCLVCSDSDRDESYAESILEKLESNKPTVNVCYDKRDIVPGKPWLREMCDAIENSAYTILLLSRSSANSEYCMFQFGVALEKTVRDRRQCLIAVLLDSQEDIGPIEDPSLAMFLRVNQNLVFGERWFWDKLVYTILGAPRETSVNPSEIRDLQVYDNTGFDELEEGSNV